jgi:hypothetical protein
MGNCPCPRCLIPKVKIPELGLKHDLARREKHARTDNVHFRANASKAHRIIHKDGKGVKSKKVEDLLKDSSHVPIKVSVISCYSRELHYRP